MERRASRAYKSDAYTANLLRQQDMSLREIVSALNENGFTTRRGKEFQAMTVKRILDRAEL